MGILTEVSVSVKKLEDPYIFFYNGVNKEKREKAGVAIFIHKKFKLNIKNWEEVRTNVL